MCLSKRGCELNVLIVTRLLSSLSSPLRSSLVSRASFSSLSLYIYIRTPTPRTPTPRFDKQIEFAFRVAICRPRGPDHRGGRERREDAGTQHVVLCSGGAGGPEHSTMCCVLAAGAGQNTAQCAVFRSPAGRKVSLDRKHYCMTQSINS